MPNCEKFVSLHSECIDGALPPRQKSEFEEHCRNCPECAERLRQMQALKMYLKELTPTKVSDTFNIVLRSRIRRELEKESLFDRILDFFVISRWPAFATSFAIILLISFVSYYLFYNPEKPATPSSALSLAHDGLESAVPASFSGDDQKTKNDVYLVVEKVKIEELLKGGEKIDSRFRVTYRQSMKDTVQTYPIIPVRVYQTTPTTSVTF